MTSDKLYNAADVVLGYLMRGETIPADTAEHLAQVLLDLGAQVRQMENIPLALDTPPPARTIARRIGRGRGEMPHGY